MFLQGVALNSKAAAFRSSAASAQRACTPSCVRAVQCRASGEGRMGRRGLMSAGLLAGSALVWVPTQGASAYAVNNEANDPRVGEIRHTDEEWRAILGKDAFGVMRKAGTEYPFSSALYNEHRKGTFACAGCGSPLFSSETKYDSGTGWPSFYQPLPGAVDETKDDSIPLYRRVEIRCHTCKGHLGHVFEDGPRPTGLRYCMNGLALKFKPEA